MYSGKVQSITIWFHDKELSKKEVSQLAKSHFANRSNFWRVLIAKLLRIFQSFDFIQLLPSTWIYSSCSYSCQLVRKVAFPSMLFSLFLWIWVLTLPLILYLFYPKKLSEMLPSCRVWHCMPQLSLGQYLKESPPLS